MALNNPTWKPSFHVWETKRNGQITQVKGKTKKFETSPDLSKKMITKGKNLGRDKRTKSAKLSRLAQDIILNRN